MSKILHTIAKIDNIKDLEKFMDWMEKNNIDTGYRRTAFEKFISLEDSEEDKNSEKN